MIDCTVDTLSRKSHLMFHSIKMLDSNRGHCSTDQGLEPCLSMNEMGNIWNGQLKWLLFHQAMVNIKDFPATYLRNLHESVER